MSTPKPPAHAKDEKKSDKTKGCGRGGKRANAGRKPGSRNRNTIELQTAAKEHAPDALATLVQLAKSAASEAVQCSAAQAILDRAFGRPRQTLEHTGDPDAPMQHKVDFTAEAFEEIARRIAEKV